MPSAYTSNGTGRCCQRKSPPSAFTTLAIGPMICTNAGLALMSAAESRLVFSLPPRTGSDPSVIRPMLTGLVMSGPPCSERPRRRSSLLSSRRSRPRAYVDGSVRERATSPSSLSKVSSCADMPRKPASSASSSRVSITPSSTAVGRTSLRVARSSPITEARMSECPMNAATFGPSGRDSSASTYSRALRQEPPRSRASMTKCRGIASTRPNRSPAVVGSTWIVDSEQEPIMIVVTPCRTDSLSAGPSSTSTS